MTKAGMQCTPGWDVPRDFYAPDEPSADEDSFWEMVEERFEIIDCSINGAREPLCFTTAPDA